MLLMIDNYDSFTFTLVNYLESLGQEVLVKRNDELSISQIAALNPDKIVLSPGPCSPNEAGISLQAVQHFYTKPPILGVCLGHQVIAQQFGANVVRANKVMHGKTSSITHNQTGLFANLPNPMTVTRYHSLIVEEQSLPEFIEPTAWVDQTLPKEQHGLMALSLKDYPVAGVQFHPESIMSEQGLKLLSNFLTL